MNLDEQIDFVNIVNDDFETMKELLDNIRDNLALYPVLTQKSFLTPLKTIIFNAWQDTINKDDYFLNNFEGDDIVTV